MLVTMNGDIDVSAVGRGFLDNEAKVHRNSLEAVSSMARILMTVSGFVKLGLGTDRTSIQISGQWNLRNAQHMLVHTVDMPVMHVTKALMPKNALLIMSQMSNHIISHGRSKKLVFERWSSRERSIAHGRHRVTGGCRSIRRQIIGRSGSKQHQNRC